ncbi:auxin-responsive protein SAUR76 [Malania oleifera]|uniref:auxin-responsive protein SAUR76 n=1 Tax=Malania oleifera TaxID=397392 RepID=UPI0025AE7D4F|nr:auxin-responsive protein SAUR76 [Malania oleifera]
MDCLVLPVTKLRRWSSGSSRRGYRRLLGDGVEEWESSPVTVVVGKEKREFQVEAFVLEESPFRVLMETTSVLGKERLRVTIDGEKPPVIFVDVDAILFEHMLWLMRNDCSSLFQLNLKEIIEFYADQDY